MNSIKAAPTREPFFYLDTDTTFSENNIGGRTFQFATQFIYDDGEESAISPYSNIMFVDEARITGVDSTYSPSDILEPERRVQRVRHRHEV